MRSMLNIKHVENMLTMQFQTLNIAKTYRRQMDVSHYPMFHQFEGLVVDKNISITHLRGTIDYFAKNFSIIGHA